MQKILTRGDKKLLKGLKMEYFHEIMMTRKQQQTRYKEEGNIIRNENGRFRC